MITPTYKNHDMKNCPYQKLNSLVVFENIIILYIYFVERGLINGYVVFFFQVSPLLILWTQNTQWLTLYIIFNFQNILIPDKEKCLPDKPWVWVTIPVEFFQREKCFSQIKLFLYDYANHHNSQITRHLCFTCQGMGKIFHNSPESLQRAPGKYHWIFVPPYCW